MVDHHATVASVRSSDPPPAPDSIPVRPPEGITFLELLASLNPLQHIPVIGTIYRAITGDVIPEASRRVGSFAVSGLMGGPIGMVTNLALLAIEKLTGIDPERVGQEILASVGIGSPPEAVPSPAEARQAVTQPYEPTLAPSYETAAPLAWSASQLLAYGVRTDDGGDLRRGDLRGSDVLNDLFLVRFAA